MLNYKYYYTLQMATLRTIDIEGKCVKLAQHDIMTLNTSTMFNGQKLLHPFVTKTITKEITKQGKGNKQIIQTVTDMVYTPEITPDALYDLQHAVRFDMKHDGSCGFLLWDVDKKEFIPYARYDVKKQNSTFPDVPKDGIPCESMPTDPDATHWPHFVPCSSKPKDYKWYLHAFEQAKKSGKLDRLSNSFTVEYMGKKFNYKPCDGVEQDAVIVPHGLVTLDIPVELRTYDGFKKIMEAFPFMEGIIIRGKEKLWKVRRELFSNEDIKLKWPSGSTEKISELVMFA